MTPLLQIGKPPPSRKKSTGIPTPEEIPGILHVVALAFGKGGVDKTTIASFTRTRLTMSTHGADAWLQVGTR